MKKALITLFTVIIVLTAVSCASTSVSEDKSQDGITYEFYTGAGKVYKVSANAGHGYNIVSYLVIPNDVKYSHLYVYPYKSGSRHDYAAHEKEVRTKLKNGNPVADRLKAITLWLVLPQDEAEYMRLGTLLNEPGKWKRLDNQIKNAIEDVYSFLESEGITLKDGIVISGYSGEGSTCVNFAMLHPEMVHAVAAGGLAWHVIVPMEQIDSHNLNWPLGINNYKQVTGYSFDYESWKNIKFYLDQGLLDDRGIKYGRRLEQAGFSIDNERRLWDTFASAMAECTPNAELVLYNKVGHAPVHEDYIRFLKENEGEEFKPITPSKEAVVLLGEK